MEAKQPGHGATCLRFGNTDVDLPARRVCRGDGEIELDRSSFDVLAALLAHPGEVLTKEELFAAAWPGRIVSDNSLAKAISRLRNFLGEDGQAIRVVHGYGYRLTAPVHLSAHSPTLVLREQHEPDVAVGGALPHKPGWILERKLGQGSAGTVYLSTSKFGTPRAVKITTCEAGLISLKREVALQRYVQASGQELSVLSPLLEWNLQQPPFYVEMPFHADGHLRAWEQACGGLSNLNVDTRLAIFTELCEGIGQLHDLGIIHKDLKPENLYPIADAHAPGGRRLQLGDLGSSEAGDATRFAQLGITIVPESPHKGSFGGVSPTGTVLYIAPEVIAGQHPTQRSDIYALGVLLYQFVCGDLRRAVAPGWEQDIADPLLREDIALTAANNPELRLGDAHTLARRLRSLPQRRMDQSRIIAESEQAAKLSKRLDTYRRRRNVWAIIAAAFVLTSSISGWMYLRERKAAAISEASRREAELVSAYMSQNLLAQANPYLSGQRDLTLSTALKSSLGDIDSRFRNYPALQAQLYSTIGRALSGRGNYQDAIIALSNARRLLLPLQNKVREIAVIDTDLCKALVWQGRLALAATSCKSAEEGFKSLGLREMDQRLAAVELLHAQGFYKQCAEESLAAQGVASITPRQRIRSDWFAGVCQLELGLYAEAQRDLERAREASHVILGEWHPESAWILSDYANLLVEGGRLVQAREQALRAQALFEHSFDPLDADRSAPLYQIAQVDLLEGRWADAHERLEKVVKQRGTLSTDSIWVANPMADLAWARAELGNPESREVMRHLHAVVMALRKDTPRVLGHAEESLVRALIAEQDFETARRWLSDFSTPSNNGNDTRYSRTMIDCYVAILDKRSGTANAQVSAGQCLQRLIAVFPQGNPRLAYVKRQLGAT